MAEVVPPQLMVDLAVLQVGTLVVLVMKFKRLNQAIVEHTDLEMMVV